MTIEFATAWRGRYGAADPAGWLLRTRCYPRWLRIDGLAGKRYPESLDEVAEIHRRHEALAAAIFPAGQEACWILIHEWEVSGPTRKRFAELPDLELELGWRGERHEDGVVVNAWVAPTTWSAAATRAVRQAVIEERLRALWVSCATLEVFAPYNGGVDVFAADSARRDDLARQFVEWRSPRPDGL